MANKQELLDQAEGLGLNVSNDMTKAEIQSLIDDFNIPDQSGDEDPEVEVEVEVDTTGAKPLSHLQKRSMSHQNVKNW